MGRWSPPLSRQRVIRECPRCRYSLEGITAFRCPECGSGVLAIRATRERALTGPEAAWLDRASWASRIFVGRGCLTLPLFAIAALLGVIGFYPGRLTLKQVFVITGIMWIVLVPLLVLWIWWDSRDERLALRHDREGARALVGELEVRKDPLGDNSPRRIAVEFLPRTGRILCLRWASDDRLTTATRDAACVDADELGRVGVVRMDELDAIIDLEQDDPRLFDPEDPGSDGEG